jgi:hypothetical protein
MHRNFPAGSLLIALAFGAVVPVEARAAECTQTQKKTYDSPTQGGRKIDKCVQGSGWGLFDSSRCDLVRRKAVAQAFCRAKGHDAAANEGIILPEIGSHSIWTYPKGEDSKNGSWTQVQGSDVFRQIDCEDTVQTANCANASPPVEEKTFVNPRQSGLRIDGCVWGSGWTLTDLTRCHTNDFTTDVPRAFCRGQGFSGANHGRTGPHVGKHAIWTYAKGTNPARGGRWAEIPIGATAFDEIRCKR